MMTANFDGDTYSILDVPVKRQRQELVSKRQLKKIQRQYFNNMSLKRKIQFRKVGVFGAKVITR